MFNPNELLKFVKTIRRKQELQTDAGIRTAINRSYYSSMLTAKSRLEKQGEKFSETDEIHKHIIEKIKAKNIHMGDKLNSLYKLRLQADLDLEFDADKAYIAHAYGIAISFNSKIDLID